MTHSTLASRIYLPQNGAFYTERLEDIELAVLHTAETGLFTNTAYNVCRYLAHTQSPNRASCHYCTDPWEIVAQCHEEWTAWTAPGANANGINIEQAGQAHKTDWSSSLARQMIFGQTVPLLADICRRYNIPPVVCEPADLLLGRKGITDHIRVNQAFKRSDHTDCGNNYPIYEVAEAVARLVIGIPPDEDGDEMNIVRSEKGTVYVVDGLGKKEVIGAPQWKDTEWAINQLVKWGVVGAYINPLNDAKEVGVPQGALDILPTF